MSAPEVRNPSEHRLSIAIQTMNDWFVREGVPLPVTPIQLSDRTDGLCETVLFDSPIGEVALIWPKRDRRPIVTILRELSTMHSFEVVRLPNGQLILSGAKMVRV